MPARPRACRAAVRVWHARVSAHGKGAARARGMRMRRIPCTRARRRRCARRSKPCAVCCGMRMRLLRALYTIPVQVRRGQAAPHGGRCGRCERALLRRHARRPRACRAGGARMPCRRCGTRTAPHRMRMPRCVPGLPLGGVECGMLIVNAALSSANDDGRTHGFPGEQEGPYCASSAGILELSLLSTAPARCSVHAVVHAVGRRHSAWAHCVSCPRCARPARQARRPRSGFVSL